MSLIVDDPGLRASIQDRGRFGAREWGVAVGGAFDLNSFGLANALLDNPLDAASIELTLLGGSYRAKTSMALALAGAIFETRIERSNGDVRALSIPQSFTLEEGDRLVLGRATRGVRGYLAVQGGWRTPIVLGSRSIEKPLIRGEILPTEGPSKTLESRIVVNSSLLADPEDGPIRVVDGPDFDRLKNAETAWEGLRFRVGSKSDRIGLRLEGELPEFEAEANKLSAPIAPGTIQGTASGLIVLGVACGTMGGYPHLAQVISSDLDRLAQAKPGDRIFFLRISIEEARRLDRADRSDRRRRLERVAEICRLSRRAASTLSRSRPCPDRPSRP